MNTNLKPIVVLLMAFAAAPLLAQPGGQPAAGAQTQQPVAGGPAVTDTTATPHVVGTVVTVGADRLELMVEKAVGPAKESASVLVGQTHVFVLDARTQKPAQLKPGDHVDLWFSESDGQGFAARIAIVPDDVQPTQPAATPQGSTAPDAPTTTGSTAAPTLPAATTAPAQVKPEKAAVQAATAPAAAPKRNVKPLVPPLVQPAATPISPDAGAGVTAVPPPLEAQASAAAPTEPAGSVGVAETVGAIGANAGAALGAAAKLQRNDPFPFIGIGAAVAAIALALLYFTVRGRGRILDLNLHAGKGGVL